MHRKQNPTLMNRRTLLATAIASLGGLLSGCSIEETENKISEITGRQPWVPRNGLYLHELCGHQVRPDSRWKIRSPDYKTKILKQFSYYGAGFISKAKYFNLQHHDKIFIRGNIYALIVSRKSLHAGAFHDNSKYSLYFDHNLNLKNEFLDYIKLSPIHSAPPHCQNYLKGWKIYRFVRDYNFEKSETLTNEEVGPNSTRPNRLCLAVREGPYGHEIIDFAYELDDWNYEISDDHYNRPGRLYDVIVRKDVSPHVTIIMIMSSLALNGLDDIIASLKPNLEACERRKGKPDDLDGWPDHSL